MKEITILSGKGGTGKTSFTAALSSVAKNAILCDNDVDAADLHLILKPEVQNEYDFVSGKYAVIDQIKCQQCNLCIDNCRFGAIKYTEGGGLSVNPFMCEGCRLCERICPAKAIDSVENRNNAWYVSLTRNGTMVHAKMGPGEENSGKLVSKIRSKAKDIAKEVKADFIINDGPPGIGCAAISSLSGTNQVILVTEPTKSGLNDASRLIELIKSFKIPVVAVINKYDLNLEMSNVLVDFLKDNNIPVLAKLPFDKVWVESMIQEKTVVEYLPESEITRIIEDIWCKISVDNKYA